jgi:uncharacterized protein YeaO (DUF488 family)
VDDHRPDRRSSRSATPHGEPVDRIALVRVYDVAPEDDRPRFLVERLWPRGVRRADLRLDDWLRDAGPSDELRRWFGHEPAKWDEFRRRYAAELDRRPEAWRPLLDAAGAGDIVVLYSSRDVEHNNAVALRDHLLARLPPPGRREGACRAGEDPEGG